MTITDFLNQAQQWRSGNLSEKPVATNIDFRNYKGVLRDELAGFTFRSCIFSDMSLTGLNLYQSRFESCDFDRATFTKCQLGGAHIRNCYFRGVVAKECGLRHMAISGNIITNTKILHLELARYNVTYFGDTMQIGCQNHKLAKWWKFTPLDIEGMDGEDAADWWKRYKPLIRSLIRQVNNEVDS